MHKQAMVHVCVGVTGVKNSFWESVIFLQHINPGTELWFRGWYTELHFEFL